MTVPEMFGCKVFDDRQMRARLSAKVYASLKFQGPTFYPDDTVNKNQVWCDRVVVVQE